MKTKRPITEILLAGVAAATLAALGFRVYDRLQARDSGILATRDSMSDVESNRTSNMALPDIHTGIRLAARSASASSGTARVFDQSASLPPLTRTMPPSEPRARPARPKPPQPSEMVSPKTSGGEDSPLLKPISKYEARAALSDIGKDPDAEVVWLQAINDPSRSPNEREDLIEDLNEEGIPGRKRLTAEHLPVIERRLRLIDEQAPNAMDETNAAAFREAHKDLTQMRARLTR